MPDKPRYDVELMEEVVVAHGGQVYLAANELGCSPQTIYNYLKRYPRLQEVCGQASQNRWRQNGKNRGELKNTKKQPLVYFIQCGDNGPIKIGTSVNPDRRLFEYRIGCPYPLKFIGVMNGNRHLEKRLHKMFAEFNIQREWFEPVPELIKFIEANSEPLGELANL